MHIIIFNLFRYLSYLICGWGKVQNQRSYSSCPDSYIITANDEPFWTVVDPLIDICTISLSIS